MHAISIELFESVMVEVGHVGLRIIQNGHTNIDGLDEIDIFIVEVDTHQVLVDDGGGVLSRVGEKVVRSRLIVGELEVTAVAYVL